MTKISYISTRGYYDLATGKTLKNNSYHFSFKDFEKLKGKNEVVIMVHGLRNDRKSARQKFVLAKNRLKKIGYKYPVIGYSYDSNTKGAHLRSCVKKSLRVGQLIAKKNGHNLSNFIIDLKKLNSKIKIRLIGHSLGSEVILSTLMYLSKQRNTKNIIESAYFFGSSVQRKNLVNRDTKLAISRVIKRYILNFYAPNDEVLAQSTSIRLLKEPVGLCGIKNKFIKYLQKKVYPKNHRFASYVKTIASFP